MKSKTFLLIWRTSTSKYQIVEGPTIEDACNNAGIGRGALPALDYYADITPIANGRRLKQVMRDVQNFAESDSAYYWSRENCAKIQKLCSDLLTTVQNPHGGERPATGWKPGPAFQVVYEKFCKED